MEKLTEKKSSQDKMVDYVFKFVLGSIIFTALMNLALNIFVVYKIVTK